MPFVVRGLAAEPRRFRIGTQKGEPVLLSAQKTGSLQQRLGQLGATVEFVEFEFGPPILEAMRAGAIDFGAVGDVPPVFALAGRGDLLFVAAEHGGASAILLPPGSTLQTVRALKGKRVAFARGSSAQNTTVAALEKAGLSFSDIQPVYLGPSDAAPAFAHGQVDAWTVWDPYYAITERQPGVRVLAETKDIAPQNSFYLASRSTAEKAPDLVAAAVAEVIRASVYAASHRDEVAKLASTATGIALEPMQRTIARMPLDLQPMNDTFAQQEQQVADRFYRLGLVPRQVEISRAVWHPAT
jgi:NitT/TauT family transport system substrate-binding protein/sulfonate transport system substrate-binding protein